MWPPRRWAGIAVAVLDDRHRARRHREPEASGYDGVEALFCSSYFGGA